MSSNVYGNLAELEKEFIIGAHKHLNICRKCRNYYTDTKRYLASNIIFFDDYPPASFRLLKENELILNSLISKIAVKEKR